MMTSSADFWYGELLQVAAEGDARRAYRRLNRVFLRLLDEQTRQAEGLRFGGTFAKTDFLLKENLASLRVRAIVHDARVRLRRQDSLTAEELRENLPYDLEAIGRLVETLTRTPSPQVLQVRYPAPRQVERRRVPTDCLRILVTHCDDAFIYGEADVLGGQTVKVRLREEDRYLVSLLQEGRQLNLVRPAEEGDELRPELIILEPDYLVDISAIAACFESYATSPLVHLLNKLKPQVQTPATMLGHLASQMLDEALTMKSDESSYADSLRRFFRDHAFDVLTTPLDASFHVHARQQRENILRAINEGLGQNLGRFHREDVMLEPSFFSEMLGLQGRMDFLQLDLRVLIEQKSGKGGFPQRDPDTPVQQTKHYVQMLLYMLLIRYNYREQYLKTGRQLHSFLLYSKYRNGLLALGFAPQLVSEAIRLRNELVAREYDYTRGAMSQLLTLTPEMLNERHTSGKLWTDYQRPQLEALLAPIHHASELEQHYYLRMLTFVATEHLLAKIGTQTKENSGFADKWHSTLEEKLQAGNIRHALTLLSPQAGDEGKVEQVVMGCHETEQSDNFRRGDIVLLYPYEAGGEPDARRTMVFRCTIERLDATRMTLSLRAAQTNASVFLRHADSPWAIEHDLFESSHTALYRGLHAFLSAPKERRDLLLLQRQPRVDTSLRLRGDYGGFNELALRVRQARDLFLIIGPPGTGKTSFGMLNTLKEELLEPGATVLVLSYTNRAVDEVCGKLVEQGIPFLRIGGRHSCEEAYRDHLFDAMVDDCPNVDELRRRMDDVRVVVCTTTAMSTSVALLRQKPFSLAIIDEASQILEPHLMALLSATTPEGEAAIGRLVLIGDHKQLPAVMQQSKADSAVDDPLLLGIGLKDCRLSLFERLLARYADNPAVCYMLTRQGRMHHDIAHFPSKAFYGGQLREVPLPHQTEATPQAGTLLDTHRVAFVAVEPQETDELSDKVNVAEAEVIARQVHQIYEKNPTAFSPQDTVGIIVPYRNQIAAIRQAIGTLGIAALADITIDTVERYQGSQRDNIIYGFTIRKPYQLAFLTDHTFTDADGQLIDRKLNVAMTRARKHLLLVGNPTLLRQAPVFARLLDEMGYFSACSAK